ncbi:hypothetical protein ACPFMM_003429 [Vibrio cholerae]
MAANVTAFGVGRVFE